MSEPITDAELPGMIVDANDMLQLHWSIATERTATNTKRLVAEVRRLREALYDAIDLADDAWSYVDDYFKSKWNFAEDMAKLRAALGPQEDAND